MRTETEIRAQIAEIEKDERLHYPAANIQINAALALVQLTHLAVLETQLDTLRWVLEEKEAP